MADIRLIAGLGNPGREYENTRHNVGFLILDRLARDLGAVFTKQAKWQGEVGKAGGVHLVKPLTFMNLSGQSVVALARFHRLTPDQCLIVYDDKDLPCGQLRMREGGSAGGHNGMKSLIAHFGTDAFPRLRFGIGAARSSVVNHVLGQFTTEERASLEKPLDRAVDAIKYALQFGPVRAMTLFNRNEEQVAPPKERPTKTQDHHEQVSSRHRPQHPGQGRQCGENDQPDRA